MHICKQGTGFLLLHMLMLCSKETEMPTLMQRLIHYLSAFAFQLAEAPALAKLQEAFHLLPFGRSQAKRKVRYVQR